MNNNGVINGSMTLRIEEYFNEAEITSNVEKNQYRKILKRLEEGNGTHAEILFVRRGFEAFNLVNEKRTTRKMFLEDDIDFLQRSEKEKYPSDKTSGRNFIELMKQNDTQNVNDDNGLDINKTLTKVNTNSNAYQIYSDAA